VVFGFRFSGALSCFPEFAFFGDFASDVGWQGDFCQLTVENGGAFGHGCFTRVVK
jgi:hypothetical protein